MEKLYPYDFLTLKAFDVRFRMEKYYLETLDTLLLREKFSFGNVVERNLPFGQDPDDQFIQEMVKNRREKRQTEDMVSRTSISGSNIKRKGSGETIKVLMLDGGGMRGWIELELLQKIKEGTGKEMYELFDVIGGTSTGGLIAMLIRFGYSIEKIKELYSELGNKIFDLDERTTLDDKFPEINMLMKAYKTTHGLPWYNVDFLEEQSESFLKNCDLSELHNQEDRPFTFLCSSKNDDISYSPYIFRTYQDPFKDAKNKPAFYSGTDSGKGITVVDSVKA